MYRCFVCDAIERSTSAVPGGWELCMIHDCCAHMPEHRNVVRRTKSKNVALLGNTRLYFVVARKASPKLSSSSQLARRANGSSL